MAPPTEATDVVIVGAGPAGLALAIELGQRGIRCLIVERDDRRGWAPRAKTTHCRTREHMRRWGIADKLAAASPFGVDYPSHVLFVTRLGGHLLKRFDYALDCNPAQNEDYSEHGQWVPQYKLEEVLLEEVRRLPHVTIRNGCTFDSFTQDAAGVEVTLTHASGTETLRAAYLVGADGARSAVREAIGAEMVGTYGLSRNYNVIFRAPELAKLHRHGPGIMYWQINDEVPSLIGPMDQGDLWFFMPTGVSADLRLSPEDAAETIRHATGIDTEIEVLSSDEWVASRFLASHYAKGRAFLVGDACHLHPPFGGFGMNLGVSDSVDLGWKLAATLQGWGGPDLLASYEIERRQAHEIVLDAAEANHTMLANQLARPGIEDNTPEGAALRAEVTQVIEATKRAEFYARGVVLGYCYRNSPVVADDGTQALWQRTVDYVPLAIPGALAPHRWLADGTSLYDHFGPGLTLLATNGTCEDDCLEAAREAEALGVPLKVLDLRDAYLGPLYEAPLVLIRPDQHVAWRGVAWPGAGLLKQALGGL